MVDETGERASCGVEDHALIKLHLVVVLSVGVSLCQKERRRYRQPYTLAGIFLLDSSIPFILSDDLASILGDDLIGLKLSASANTKTSITRLDDLDAGIVDVSKRFLVVLASTSHTGRELGKIAIGAVFTNAAVVIVALGARDPVPAVLAALSLASAQRGGEFYSLPLVLGVADKTVLVNLAPVLGLFGATFTPLGGKDVIGDDKGSFSFEVVEHG